MTLSIQPSTQYGRFATAKHQPKTQQRFGSGDNAVALNQFVRDWYASGCQDPRLACIWDIPSLPEKDRREAYITAVANLGHNTPLSEDQKDSLVEVFPFIPEKDRTVLLKLAHSLEGTSCALGPERLAKLNA